MNQRGRLDAACIGHTAQRTLDHRFLVRLVVLLECCDERLDVAIEICGCQMLADGVPIVLDRGGQERRGLTYEFR